MARATKEAQAASLPSWVPPGWYPDPLSVGAARYWDGSSWSKHHRDAPPPQAVPESPPDEAGLSEPEESQAQRVDDAPVGTASRAPGDPLLAGLKARVRRRLEENLMDEERVRVVVNGAFGQAIVATDTRAFVCKPGLMAGATFGAEITSWAYTQIVGVQVHKGFVSGAVAIQAPGQTASNMSYWGNKNDDPAKAPNAIPVNGNWKAVNGAVAELRKLLAAHHAGGVASPTAPSAPEQSPLDHIRQLGELREAGVLTEQEFETKKAELLRRL